MSRNVLHNGIYIIVGQFDNIRSMKHGPYSVWVFRCHSLRCWTSWAVHWFDYSGHFCYRN